MRFDFGVPLSSPYILSRKLLIFYTKGEKWRTIDMYFLNIYIIHTYILKHTFIIIPISDKREVRTENGAGFAVLVTHKADFQLKAVKEEQEDFILWQNFLPSAGECKQLLT